MLKETLAYTGRIWLNRLDHLVGKAKNGRYYRKFRLLDDSKQFHTLTVFANKASELFALPETLVVRNLPVQVSKYTHNDKEYQVFSAEYTDLLKHIREGKPQK
jgi:hypothetical protein